MLLDRCPESISSGSSFLPVCSRCKARTEACLALDGYMAFCVGVESPFGLLSDAGRSDAKMSLNFGFMAKAGVTTDSCLSRPSGRSRNGPSESYKSFKFPSDLVTEASGWTVSSFD